MNNTIILNDCIEEFKAQNELSIRDSDVFELFTGSLITKNYEFSFDELEAGVVDGALDGGIDTIMLVIDDNYMLSEEQVEDIKFKRETEIVLIICQSKINTTHKESTLDKIISSIPYFFNLELSEESLYERFNPSVVEKILFFRSIWRRAARKQSKITIKYFYCSKANECRLDSSYISKTNQIIELTEQKVKGAKAIFSTLSASELLDLYQKSKTTELDIKFKEPPAFVTYGDGKIGYIGVTKLEDYYQFIKDEEGNLRETLFESNVRHYQGNVDVNSKIRETLSSDYETDFWWLNNGITIIASHVGIYGKTLSLNDVQIVNGLQTSYTIGKHYKKIESDDRSVLVKIIETVDKETIDKIISSTNRQNPVSPTLLRATDDIQRKLEIFFEQNGYYYDRRKNFHKNQGKPLSKIFGIQTTAQAIHAIMNLDPTSARQKPTTLIKTDESYHRIFDAKVQYSIYLKCCLILKNVSDYIKSDVPKEDRVLARSFKYHLSRIVTSNVTGKSHYGKKDLENLDLNHINKTLLDDSLNELKTYYKNFQKLHALPNLNTVTKSMKFQDRMNTELIKKHSSRSNKTQSPVKLKPNTKLKNKEEVKKGKLSKLEIPAYYIPILKVLSNAKNGQLNVQNCIKQVEPLVKDKLKKDDFEMLQSTGETRWENNVKWARNDLKKLGLLAGDSPRGIWGITTKGLDFLKRDTI